MTEFDLDGMTADARNWLSPEVSSLELARHVEDLVAEVRRLRTAVRVHRDERGDDRCWLDDENLYRVLPEGYTPPPRSESVELELCKKFIACRHNPGTRYVSPQRRIGQLEEGVREMLAEVLLHNEEYSHTTDETRLERWGKLLGGES